MKTPIRIVFDAYHLYHLPQFDPVIDKMIQDNQFEVFLTTSPETEAQEYNLTKEILRARNCPLILADDEHERAQKIKALMPDVFICGWSRYPIEEMVTDSTIVGMIYHGIGVKPSYWRDNSSRLNVRFVEGPFRVRQLREKGIQTDLELVGFPKIDPLFNGQIGIRLQQPTSQRLTAMQLNKLIFSFRVYYFLLIIDGKYKNKLKNAMNRDGTLCLLSQKFVINYRQLMMKYIHQILS